MTQEQKLAQFGETVLRIMAIKRLAFLGSREEKWIEIYLKRAKQIIKDLPEYALPDVELGELEISNILQKETL
jgi:hypothetical protein